MRSVRELVMATIETVRATLLLFINKRRLNNWGATRDEVRARCKGDELMPGPDVRLIRAITVEAPPEDVWPWVAQTGRGAGYYSYDVLDNLGKFSADHLLDIPPLALGDRNEAIGEVVHIEPGRKIVWQLSDRRIPGATAGMVLDYTISPGAVSGSRVVFVFLGRARGPIAWLLRRMIAVMDYVMATEHLRGLKWRVETYADRQKRGVIAPCAGAADHQSHSITYAGQTEGESTAAEGP